MYYYQCVFFLFSGKTYVRYLAKESAIKAWKGLNHKLKDFSFPLARRECRFVFTKLKLNNVTRADKLQERAFIFLFFFFSTEQNMNL